jgi:hypothetical protein
MSAEARLGGNTFVERTVTLDARKKMRHKAFGANRAGVLEPQQSNSRLPLLQIVIGAAP